jgi:GGDEF domain-containing protein
VDAVLERVQHAIDQPFNVDGHQIRTTASVGIALASEHGPRPQDMLRAADTSMYQVKSARA